MDEEIPFDLPDDPEMRASALLAYGLLGDDIPGIGRPSLPLGSGHHSTLARAVLGDEIEQAQGGGRYLPGPPGIKARRRTHHIPSEQVVSVLDAIYFANFQGVLMNAELTMTFMDLGCADDAECHEAFARFLDRLRAWKNGNKVSVPYFYVWERARDRGLHVHFQGHVPAHLHDQFRKWVVASMESLPGRWRKFGRPHLKLRRQPSVNSQFAWTRYLLKGVRPQQGLIVGGRRYRFNECGIKPRVSGEVVFKRVGISESVGAAARKLAGFQPLPWDGDDPFATIWTGRYYDMWREREEQQAFNVWVGKLGFCGE